MTLEWETLLFQSFSQGWPDPRLISYFLFLTRVRTEKMPKVPSEPSLPQPCNPAFRTLPIPLGPHRDS